MPFLSQFMKLKDYKPYDVAIFGILSFMINTL